MSKSLPYDEIEFDRKVKLEKNLNTPENSDIGYFVEVDLRYSNIIKERTKNSPCALENKKELFPMIIVIIRKQLNQLFLLKPKK